MDMEKIRKHVEKQIENPDWDKIKAKADEKRKLFEGIVSAEGALHLAVQELYPEYKASPARKAGTTLIGRMINKTKVRFVNTKKVKNQPIKDVFIATEDTGVLQATLWGKNRVELFTEIEHGDAIAINDVKVGNKDGETVINFFDNSTVEKIDDKDVSPLQDLLEPIDLGTVKKSKIGALKGVIIQVTDIDFQTCPICGSKLTEVDKAYHCATHGEVKPEVKHAKEITIDTGSGIMPTVLWPELLQEAQPEQLDTINAVCRAYDSNYFAREKAKQESDTTEEVLNKQYPRDLRLSIYSYDLVKYKSPAKETTKKEPEQETIPEETV